MGMYDEIICRYPLPGTPSFVRTDHLFQTKDLGNTLSVYQISEDGQLIDEDGSACRFSGDLAFDASNICGGSPSRNGGYVQFTDDGSDGVSVSYVATFEAGKLVSIREEGRTVGPALPLVRMNDEEFQPSEAEFAK